nr:major urinary protein 5-like [Microcebus murinus]XP_020145027.1 major urinary protein 5-like [Microcebus murinus]
MKLREMQIEGIEHPGSLSLSGNALGFVLWERTGKGFQLLPMDQRSSELYSVSSTDDGHTLANILETDYVGYLIYHAENSNNEGKSQIMELYGREPDVSPELKEKFVEYCRAHGIAQENILDLTKINRCLQARDNALV